MGKFWSGTLALGCLAMLVPFASGQQYQRQGYRTGQPQTQQRQPQYRQQPQYGQQPQYRQQPQQRTAERTYSAATDEYGRPRATINNADRKIAVLLANCNKAEFKLAKYALNRAESSEVRSFADSLLQDHDLTINQLRRFAPEIGSADSTGNGRGYEGEQRRSGEGRMMRAWDDMTVAQQISDRLVRKARDELSEKEGWEFDHTFVGQQLVAHQQDIAKMEVYRQYASPELRQVIDEAIQIAEGHEQEARDLAMELGRGEQGDESAEGRSARVSSRDRDDWDDDERDYRNGDREDRDRDDDRDDDDRDERDDRDDRDERDDRDYERD